MEWGASIELKIRMCVPREISKRKLHFARWFIFLVNRIDDNFQFSQRDVIRGIRRGKEFRCAQRIIVILVIMYSFSRVWCTPGILGDRLIIRSIEFICRVCGVARVYRETYNRFYIITPSTALGLWNLKISMPLATTICFWTEAFFFFLFFFTSSNVPWRIFVYTLFQLDDNFLLVIQYRFPS